MSVAIVILIGKGSFEEGFPVSLQVLERRTLIKDERNYERLPPAPDIPRHYRDLKESYKLLGESRTPEPVQGQTTHCSSDEVVDGCQTLAKSLKKYLKNWFQNRSFQSLKNWILVEATSIKSTSVPVIVDTDTGSEEQDTLLHKLPWELWDLFRHLNNAELVLKAKVDRPVSPLKYPVKILAILGSSEGGLQLDDDKRALEHLKRCGAEIELKKQPRREEIHKLLWDYSWDIFFFAGHSFSEAGHQSGYLQIGNGRTLSLDGLEADLDRAVDQGLKLAIFNSCDGLGIARYLADRNVPSMIVMREPVPDLVARKFLQYFLKAFASGKPLCLAVREARKQLQAQETDDEYPCPIASWLPIVCQNPAQPELVWPKSCTWKKIALMGVAGVAAATLISALVPHLPNFLPKLFSSPESLTSFKTVPVEIADRISFGDKNLIPTEDGKNNKEFRDYKERGIKAMAAKKYAEADSYLKKAIQSNPNAPETLIYLNNARIGNAEAHTLAAVVPIGTNQNNALEMLRGFAQAQTKVNTNGINGVPLKLLIINDDDNEKIAQKIASYLVSQPEILAVVGHWTSDVSLRAAQTYVSEKLVFIAPVSTTIKLTNSSNYNEYVYRTNINNRQGGRALATQMLRTWKKQKAAIFYTSVTYSMELRSEFEDTVKEQGGEIVAQFNLSAPNFNAEQSVEQAIHDGAEVIFIPTDNKTRTEAWKVIKANRNRLKLLGDLANLYSVDTLRECQDAALGMVLAVAWHRDKNITFTKSAKSLWGAEVNHITAISYDAVQALIGAMRRNPNREGIKNALQDSDFTVSGATGDVQFSLAGDRIRPPQLVEVQKTNPSLSGTGFDFMAIDSPAR